MPRDRMRRHMRMLLAAACLVCASSVDAGGLTIDADSQYAYAQSRLSEGAMDEAIIEFQRFIFFFPQDPRVERARFSIGMAHFNAGRHGDAALVFDALTEGYSGLPLETDAFFMLSRSHARQGATGQAIVDLHNLLAITSDGDVADRAHDELGWLHVDEGHWDQADQAFHRISPANRHRYGVDRLRQALARSDAIPRKQPTTAGMLSIVPGGGQLYCERYQDALTAFIINAGLIWAAWEAFDEDLYALGGVISVVEFGFYAGNITGAISGAHKYNRNRSAEFRESIYRLRPSPLSLAPVHGGAALLLSVNF